jgi:K+-sensing histidine kinase KdpD
VGATETSDVATTQTEPTGTAVISARDARSDSLVHDIEEPLAELVRALERRQLYLLVDDVDPPDHELLGRARALVRDLEHAVAELLDRPIAPTDPREWHDTLSMRGAFEDAAAAAKEALAGRSIVVDAPPTFVITSHAPRLHELLIELLALASRLQPAAWSVRVEVQRRDGEVVIIVPSTDRSDSLSVSDQRRVHDLARSLGGRLDVIGHPDAHAGLWVRLPQQRGADSPDA